MTENCSDIGTNFETLERKDLRKLDLVKRLLYFGNFVVSRLGKLMLNSNYLLIWQEMDLHQHSDFLGWLNRHLTTEQKRVESQEQSRAKDRSSFRWVCFKETLRCAYWYKIELYPIVFKWSIPGIFYCLFSFLSSKHVYNNILEKCPSGAGIRTHDLLYVILLP